MKTDEAYYFKSHSSQLGPYSYEDLQELFRKRVIDVNTPIRKIGGFDWCPLQKCQELFPFRTPQLTSPDKKASRHSLIEFLTNFGFFHLEPIKFEEFVMKIFEAFGVKGKLTPVTGDEGIDIELTFPDGKKAIAQCKRYNNDQSVGAKDVRELLGTMTHSNSTYGFFVTTSTFTDQAKSFVEGKTLFLIDGIKLKRLFLLACEAESNQIAIKYPLRAITTLSTYLA